ncbi:MAG: hypothetical protein KJO08_03505 [Gammaproteobacteria bacterium]|nr:hypothetical protein [Gammaproteobacteria bacterium]NNJ84865.1 hypothetical protein [Gammaproteobacteria bacterium]
MNWTEQVGSMMKMWDEAQKQFMGGWYGLASGMPGMSASTSGMPGMSGMPDLSNPMSLLMSGLPAWAKNSTTGQGAAGNLLSSQAMMMQSLGVLAQAWKAISPSLEAGKPWQPDFDTFLKQWSNEIMQAPQRFSSAGTGVSELMKSFMGEWGPLLKPWLASIQGTGLGGPLGDVLGSEKLPFGQMMKPAFQDLAQIPMVGVNREQMAKIMRAFDVHVDVRKASVKYQAVITKTIGDAMKETMEHLVELSKKGEQIKSVRELIRLWVKIADRQFTEMYVDDDFVAIQREVSSANLRNKLAQRAVLEMIFKQLEIPTRTEIDDAYKTLHGLKREVRELRNARKQSVSDSTESSKKMEAELASLRSALQKMEAKLAEQSAKAPRAAPASFVKGKENTAGTAVATAGKSPVSKPPVKVTRKKIPSQKV